MRARRCQDCGTVSETPERLGNGQTLGARHGAGICPHCYSYKTVWIDENPKYGPGNPDWERDFHMERVYLDAPEDE